MDDELKHEIKYHERRLSPKSMQERIRQERYYMKTVGLDTYSSRITVPCSHPDHFKNALECFRNLLARLEEIELERQQPKTSDVSTLYTMKQALTDCSQKLKEKADYSLKYPKAPYVDFRNTR